MPSIPLPFACTGEEASFSSIKESKPIVLVGWSFGGLICRAYLDRFGQEMHIVGLIQFASLFGGFAPYLSHLFCIMRNEL